MNIIYDLAFIVFAFFYIPIFLFKKRKREGMGLRLGIYPKALKEKLPGRRNIWVHAVSVGEVMAVSALLERLRQRYPDYRLVITTVTETGNSLAKKMVKPDEIVLFLPFDITFAVRRAVSYIKPSMLIITETELWPNLISEASKDGVAVFLVNGRISDGSFRSYSLIKFMLAPVLKKVAFFFVQSETDKYRIISLGADPSRVKVSGNMKFDASIPKGLSDEETNALACALNLGESERLIVAGSTHPGEEEAIISSYANLSRRFDGLRLLIAPRHIKRTPEIEKLIAVNGFTPIRVSQLPAPDRGSTDRGVKGIFVLDTIGQLRSCYSMAEIVFVGGSLIKRGGQNMIEPAVFAKPILFGPHTFNFRDIAELFLKEEAAIMVKDRVSLEDALARLLKDEELRSRVGRRASSIVEANRGSSDITLEAMGEKISL